jgi:hypothetical protein
VLGDPGNLGGLTKATMERVNGGLRAALAL